jgi:ribonuclease HI
MRDGERRQLAYASRRAARAPERPAPSRSHRVLCDGGSRGNPGPAAVAAVLLAPDGGTLDSRAQAIGRATAAEAEYRALLLGLALAAEHAADPLEVCSDSRLAIDAVAGDPAAGVLAAEVRAAAEALGEVRWRWHPRADNEAADALVRALLWPEATRVRPGSYGAVGRAPHPPS